jgi:hypothetical protein
MAVPPIIFESARMYSLSDYRLNTSIQIAQQINVEIL